MNPIDRNKIWKMVGILALITVVAGGLLRVSQHSSYTLRALEDDYSCADYADWNTGDRSSGSEPDAGYGGGIRERSPYKY